LAGSAGSVLTVAGGATTTFSGTLTDTGLGHGVSSPSLGLGLTSGTALTLTSTGNTYSGTTTIDATSKLIGGANNALSANSAVTNNGTLDLGTNSHTIASLNGSNAAAQVGSFSGAGAGPAVLTIGNGGSFAGTIVDGTQTAATAITLNGGTLTLSGAHTYTGASTIGDGTHAATLAVTGTGSISNSSSVAIASGATFDISAVTSPLTNLPPGAPALNGTTINTLKDSGVVAANGSTINLGANTLYVKQLQSATFSGSIQDGGSGGSVIKDGAGTLTLTGNSTHSGYTAIVNGTLALTGTGSVSNSSLVVFNGANFDVSGLTNGGTTVQGLQDGSNNNTGGGKIYLGGNTLTSPSTPATPTTVISAASSRTAAWQVPTPSPAGSLSCPATARSR
jgi:fibronectin-binding autotransporter adhesin